MSASKTVEDLAGLFNWLGKPEKFSSVGEYFSTEGPPDRALLEVLGVEKDSLKPFTLEMLESLKDTDFIRNLTRGCRAFFEFQDIFPITIRAQEVSQLNDTAQLINRDYCYYESLVYLRSSIIAALDKNPVAAMTLLRPFLELSVLQLYWFTRCESEGYARYYQWLDGHVEKPKFAKQIEEIMKKLPAKGSILQGRLKNLKERLHKLHGSLSNYNHGTKMSDSMASLGGPQTGMSLDGFYLYLATADLLMSQIVYLYVLAYPMILFPVERTTKWGVSGPIGIYVEPSSYKIVKAYLGETNVGALRASLSQLPAVANLLGSFNNQPDLSDAEQEELWTDFVQEVDVLENPTQWPVRISIHNSYYRTLRWSLNYVQSKSSVVDDRVDHDEVKSLFECAKSW